MPRYITRIKKAIGGSSSTKIKYSDPSNKHQSRLRIKEGPGKPSYGPTSSNKQISLGKGEGSIRGINPDNVTLYYTGGKKGGPKGFGKKGKAKVTTIHPSGIKKTTVTGEALKKKLKNIKTPSRTILPFKTKKGPLLDKVEELQNIHRSAYRKKPKNK